MHPRQPRVRDAGFTLVEIMIVVTILAVIASVGLPAYQSALRTARTTKATEELRTISTAIDHYRATNSGVLPLTLYEVGFGGRRDPWGTPYCYLNYSTGTGDGLAWAVSAGLVDPGAFSGAVAGGSSGSGGGGPSPAPVAVTDAPTTITELITVTARTLTDTEQAGLVTAIAEGTASVAVAVPVEATRRRDRYMFPLNTDYDLFSLGPDGQTAAALSQTMSLDDVIRANDGGYFGVAERY
ncbi:MAG: prepilin-type N-terminal cleavage/methylation domain-containing protein [Planctomycetes bacterium]|nr:prepilin-type N-terminal cleavage/methylation domain-containing protein [Planctomycetota bacterium]